ncbi:MAG TPA: hypothetical protein VG323_05430 [Thermoanaerobaculia bacterium]|nr:hypothetical protein [Thermoanaerobaculia bacterium]
MISCQTYRASLTVGTQDAALLEHLRTCDACLDYSVEVDPDNFFRSIGGQDFVPPGGVDAFVGDVMRQVHIRGKETSMASHHPLSWRQRLAIAATLAVGITGATIAWQYERQPARPSAPMAAVVHRPAPAPAPVLATKPIVETYSRNATIVEVPADGKVNVVMIFDEKLPADL